MDFVPHLPSPATRRLFGRPLRHLIPMVMGVAASACASEAAITAATPDAVEVTSTGSSMLVGATQQLSARVTSKGQSVPAVTPSWSSSDGAVASVTATGQVTALSRGSASVTATAGAARGSVSLTVLGVRAIALQPATLALPIGSSQPLTATIDADAGSTAPTVTWSSGNPSVAAVSATGVVTALAIGTATVTATSQGRTATATVVVVLPVTVSIVLVAPQTATLAIGGSQQLTATARDSAGNAITGRPVIWSSANLSVASVSATGLVNGVAPGTTNVTATVDGRSAAANITVQGPITSLAVNPATATISLGGTQAFIATAKDALGQTVTGRPVTWSAANASIATVSAQGVVTGVAPGTTTITAAVEGQRATASVTVDGLGALLANTMVAGLDHSCAIMTNARVSCWGAGYYGQRGDGTQNRRVTPEPIAGDLAFATLASGEQHTCGITTAGRLYCWGRNEEGQIGDGTTINRLAPIAVGGARTFQSVAAGQGHTCAVTTAGVALCWGKNTSGQLGDGSTINRSTPVEVSGGHVFLGIAAGWSHTCAWTAAGGNLCWGNNSDGQLGDGTSTVRTVPTTVMGGQIFAELVGGVQHSCGRTVSGVAYCWGRGLEGQLGSGVYSTPQRAPIRVSGTATYTRLSAGYLYACGIARDATLQCWGRNTDGELGDGTSTARGTPVPVSGVRQVATLGTGAFHACAIEANGTASCWGRSTNGQLGQWDVVRTPTIVPSVPSAVSVTGGYFNSCALSPAGATTCWGLGLESPAAFAAEKVFTSIEHGDFYVCGLDAARSAWCWGVNDTGKLGIGTETGQANPQAVLGGHQFTKLSGFAKHACGIDVGGAVWCWGRNVEGQIDGSGINRLIPTAITTTLRFQDVSVGYYHSCAIATDGGLYCWGNEITGSSRLSPLAVSERFTAVASQGNPFPCGIRVDKRVVCADPRQPSSFRLIDGVTSAERIEAVSGNTCALTTDRAVYCWGDNEFGQLGDPSFTESSWSRAIRVVGVSNAVALGGSYYAPCAVVASGAVYCWGYNGNREAGQPLARVPRAVSGGLTFKRP